MILGIAILWSQTGTLRMSDISVVPQGLTAVSFYLMMIGAIGKAGSMPFHTWIPDAAIDAPVSVMAFIPARAGKAAGHLPAGAHLPRFLQAGGQQPLQPGADDHRRR